MDKKTAGQYLGVIIGGVIFAIGLNTFIVPLNLYSGGVIGFAQIIRTLLMQNINSEFLLNFDITGLLNFLFNIPLFILAFQSISKKFFVKTLLCVIAQMIAITFIPIPSVPIIYDVLAACLIGGLTCGFGVGWALRCGGSGGGLDILGIYFTKKFRNFSVGKLGIIVNTCLFAWCVFIFDIQTAIYSIIFMTCMLLVLDRIHFQNINMTALIFTKKKSLQKALMNETGRGVTYWKGAGAYTEEETFILMIVISKYEVNRVKRIVKNQDEKAFIIFNEGLSVSGNFEKRL